MGTERESEVGNTTWRCLGHRVRVSESQRWVAQLRRCLGHRVRVSETQRWVAQLRRCLGHRVRVRSR